MDPNSKTIIDPYEEEMERKQIMETIRSEGDQLAKAIMKIYSSSPQIVLFVPNEANGKTGALELQIQTDPKIKELTDLYTKRWHDMVEQHNKKFGLDKIMM